MIHITHECIVAQVVHLEAGPSVGVRPRDSHAVSAGGVRIYDAVTKAWHFGGGGFGAERWMEHSQVRDAAGRSNPEGIYKVVRVSYLMELHWHRGF